jgi:hypothetical protein
MPAMFRGRCPDCEHEWEAVSLSFTCGSYDFPDQEVYRRYFCSRCFVHLNVPRVLDRNSWLNSIAGNARQIAECPLLNKTHERIAMRFAEARSRYVPISIDIGTLSCPNCREPMAPGDIDSNPLSCPRCQRQSARSLGVVSLVSLYRESD